MKLFYLLLLVSVASAARSGPYPPSGWRPSGPAFLLPTEQKSAPESENAVAADQSIPSVFNPQTEYGAPIPQEPPAAPENDNFPSYAKSADPLNSKFGNPEETTPAVSTPAAESTPENGESSTPDSSNSESTPTNEEATQASTPSEPQTRSGAPNSAVASQGQGFEEYGPPKEDQPESPLIPKFGDDAPSVQNPESNPAANTVQELPSETTSKPFVSSDCSNGDCEAQPKSAQCDGSDCGSPSTPAADCRTGSDCGATSTTPAADCGTGSDCGSPSTSAPACDGADCSQSTPASDCGNGECESKPKCEGSDCGNPSTPSSDCGSGADCGTPSTSGPVADCGSGADCGAPSTSAPACNGDDCAKTESTPAPECGADCDKSSTSGCAGDSCSDSLQAKFNVDEAKNDVQNAGDLSQVEDGKAPDDQFKNEPFANNGPAGFAEYGPPKEDTKPSVEDARRRRFSPKFKFTVRDF